MPPAEVPGGAPRDVRHGRPSRSLAANPIRVMLVDDHGMIPESFARAMEAEPDIRVVAIAGSVAEAKRGSRQPLDVVLIDDRLPDGTGADATRAIKDRSPAVRIVILSAVDDDETLLESIQAGADGYLTKDQALEDVVAMVRAAFAGATLLPRSAIQSIARRVTEARDRSTDMPPVESLTPRELEVLGALTQGLSTPEICERLHITANTLRTHVQNIMGKLHVHSKLEAVAFGLRHRLVEPPRPD